MKLTILLTVFIVALIAGTTEAQGPRCPRCPQGICPASCEGEQNVGTSCPQAPPRRMWYYDANSRTCRPMAHLGCGGNANRWCNRRACQRRCVSTEA